MGGVVMIKVKDCWDQLSSRVQQKIVSHHPHVSGDSSRKELTDPLYWELYLKELNRDEKAVVHWMALERGEVGLSFRRLAGKRPSSAPRTVSCGVNPSQATRCRLRCTPKVGGNVLHYTGRH